MTLWALGHWPESTGTAGRHRGLSEPGVSPPGQLVNTAGPRTLARVNRDSWRHRGLSEPGASPLGQLVDPASPQT